MKKLHRDILLVAVVMRKWLCSHLNSQTCYRQYLIGTCTNGEREYVEEFLRN